MASVSDSLLRDLQAAVKKAVQEANATQRGNSLLGSTGDTSATERGLAIFNGFGSPASMTQAHAAGACTPFALLSSLPGSVLRWEARLNFCGHTFHLGCYRTRPEAQAAWYAGKEVCVSYQSSRELALTGATYGHDTAAAGDGQPGGKRTGGKQSASGKKGGSSPVKGKGKGKGKGARKGKAKQKAGPDSSDQPNGFIAGTLPLGGVFARRIAVSRPQESAIDSRVRALVEEQRQCQNNAEAEGAKRDSVPPSPSSSRQERAGSVASAAGAAGSSSAPRWNIPLPPRALPKAVALAVDTVFGHGAAAHLQSSLETRRVLVTGVQGQKRPRSFSSATLISRGAGSRGGRKRARSMSAAGRGRGKKAAGRGRGAGGGAPAAKRRRTSSSVKAEGPPQGGDGAAATEFQIPSVLEIRSRSGEMGSDGFPPASAEARALSAANRSLSLEEDFLDPHAPRQFSFQSHHPQPFGDFPLLDPPERLSGGGHYGTHRGDPHTGNQGPGEDLLRDWLDPDGEHSLHGGNADEHLPSLPGFSAPHDAIREPTSGSVLDFNLDDDFLNHFDM